MFSCLNQPINHSIKHPINQSIDQSITQSINPHTSSRVVGLYHRATFVAHTIN